MSVAGIDAHATYLVVAIVSKTGELLQEPTPIANGNTSELLQLLGRLGPLEAVVETSPAWPWLYDLLTGHGHGFVLAHVKKLRVIAESNYKRDEIDAELHSVGLYLSRGRLLRKAGRQWVREHAWPIFGPEQRRLVRTHWALIKGLSTMIKRLDRQTERIGRELPVVALLETIPGIGPYRGLLIATEVLPIERFPTPEKLVGYAGLAPRSASSGLRPTRFGRIPAGANRWLRNAFVQGVVSHVRHAPDSWLSRYYDEQKKRVGWQTARIAAARKLARATHAMLRTGEVWRGEIEDGPGERSELHRPHVALTTPVT